MNTFNKSLIFIKEIRNGKSLLRIMMNLKLWGRVLDGNVLDIGGGSNPSYLRFFQKGRNLEFIGIDLVGPEGGLRIDVEKDKLPYADASIDKILLFNILEHIYNYQHLLAECHRVLKKNGWVWGFVPFLVGVHPDPHDYFRYTKESLEIIFKEAGFPDTHTEEVGWGPFAVNYNNLMNYLPIVFRVVLLPPYYLLDYLVLKLKPSLRQKFPLGYFFEIR